MPARGASSLLGLLVAVAVLNAAVGPVLADARDISVGGVWITKITQSNAGYSPEERAIEITRRITQVLSIPEFRQGAVITVHQSGANALVKVGDVLVFTVTPADAVGSGTPLAVAKQWAVALGKGLSNALPGSNFFF
jgi:hypothetical protein